MSEEHIEQSQPAARPFYTRLAIAGLVTIAVTVAVLAAAQLSSGDASGLIFFIIVLVIACVPAALIYRFGATWSLLLGGIAGLLGLVLSFGPFLAEAITNINSFFDFTGSLVATAASLLTLVASVVAIVQRRGGEPRLEGTSTETRILWGFAAVLAVLAVVSAGVTIGARDTVEDEERIGAFEMV